jgi:hypothetical protein
MATERTDLLPISGYLLAGEIRDRRLAITVRRFGYEGLRLSRYQSPDEQYGIGLTDAELVVSSAATIMFGNVNNTNRYSDISAFSDVRSGSAQTQLIGMEGNFIATTNPVSYSRNTNTILRSTSPTHENNNPSFYATRVTPGNESETNKIILAMAADAGLTEQEQALFAQKFNEARKAVEDTWFKTRDDLEQQRQIAETGILKTLAGSFIGALAARRNARAYFDKNK